MLINARCSPQDQPTAEASNEGASKNTDFGDCQAVYEALDLVLAGSYSAMLVFDPNRPLAGSSARRQPGKRWEK